MRVGIYGGTFDPPHLGHMRAAQAALKQLQLDELILMPAKLPPHKDCPCTPGSDRLAMTRLMADGMGDERVQVSELELEHAGKSYTAETLQAIHSQRPNDELFLLLGTDMFLSLQDWHTPRIIAQLAVLVPFARNMNDDRNVFSRHALRLERELGAHTQFLELPQITPLSSSALRGELAAGRGSDALWCQVYGYILLHNLYGMHADLKHLSNEELRCASYSMVLARRIPHIRGCEEAAVSLAKRWGADPELCRRAAILHDCTKYLELEEQKELCAQYGVELDEVEQNAVKLLHSKTGAALAGAIFGEGPEVCSAIFYHTTGRAHMSLMEKILYTADYIEPTRIFPEVEYLRQLAYSNLDAAVREGARLAIEEMREKERPVHYNTIACYEQLSS